MTKLIFEGKVFTGKGEGKKYIGLPWVKQQIEEKMGFSPFLGTLNLNLTEESAKRRKKLEKIKTIQINPHQGYCVGLLFKAFIDNSRCAALIPELGYYPKNVLEIIAPMNLREELELKDEDNVTVTVQA